MDTSQGQLKQQNKPTSRQGEKQTPPGLPLGDKKKKNMIEVFKCDHCSHFTQDAEEMRLHEGKCSFNPTNKKCWSCKHSFEDGYPISGSMRGCELKLNVRIGEEIGGCLGWEADD